MSSAEHLSELEFLRLRVAELSRALAERDQSMRAPNHHLEETMQDLREQSHLLRTIIEATAAETGEEFFASLVRHLTSTLHVQYALIGEVCEGRFKKIRTLAVSAGGTLADNFEYELAHTPCATALTQTVAFFDRNVQATFPQFQRLADLGAESYCGVPLRTKGGAVIGLLVVMDTKPLQHGDYLQSLLGILTSRIVVEFERRRAEQERAQALADLHNVIETIPDIMFALDTQGNLMKWNRRLGDVTGYSPEELLNKPALAFVPPEEQPRTAAAIQQVFTEGYAELDGQLLTKDLRTIPYHWTGALLKNAQGESLGITGVGRDVSGKKRAEEELKQQQRHLVDAQALAHLGSWDWDVETGEVQWSDELFRIFGYEPGAIAVTYDRFLASLHPDDHASVLAAIKDAHLGTCPYDMEYRIVRPNGEVRFIYTRGDVHRDMTGHPLSMAGTVLDITERRHVEAALRASEERLALAVAGSTDILWDAHRLLGEPWYAPQTPIWWSPRVRELLGIEDTEPFETLEQWAVRLHPDDKDHVFGQLAAHIEHRVPYDVEYRLRTNQGDHRWVRGRGQAMWDEQGEVRRMSGSCQDITDHKWAEQALRTSEARFRTLAEETTDWMWEINERGIYTYCSPKIFDLLGYEPAEALGKTPFDFMPAEEAQRVAGLFGTIAAARRPFAGIENTNRHKDGRMVVLECRGVPIIDVSGAFRGYRGFDQDITDRKEAEEKLRLSEQRQELALSGASLGLWDWDVSSGKTVFDTRWCSMIGYAVDELEPHVSTWQSLLHPEDVRTIQIILESHLKNERPDYEVEFRMRHKAGRWVWILARGRVVERDHAGAPLRMAGTHMDITDRKRTEDAIREAELRYRTIFMQAGAGVAQIESRTGRFVQVNRQYCEIVGLTEAEMLATTFGAITHPDDLEKNLENRSRLLSGEISSFTMEKRYVRKNGSIVWVNLNVAQLWRPGEMPVHHIAIVQDITERKRAEEALQRSERQLRTVLDALPVGIWLTDQSGKPVLSNPAAKQIWAGIKHIRIETAANAPGWGETIEPSNELHRWAVSHALTKGVSSLNETLDLKCLDGTKKIIRNTSVPVQDEAGVVLGAIVLNEDITALRQAQEAFQLTQFSVDHAVEGFFWIGHDARILNVNNAACRMLEYTRDELTTMTMYDIDPNLPSDFWSAHWKGLKQKRSMTFESKLWSKIGQVLDTEVTINYLDYEGTEYNCVIMRDIGERKRAEASLRQSEERYRFLVDNAPIGIFLSEGGRFAYVNREMQRILNATRVEQLIGTPVFERIAPEFHTVVKDRIHELMDNGQPVPSLDEQYVRLDGTRVDVAVTAIPASIGDRSMIQVLVLDIAERKRMEEALRQRERDLRAAVEERERISQDLHDGILQSLFATGLTLETAKSMMSPRNRQMLSPSIDQVIDQLNRVMHEIRNFIAGLGLDLLKGKDLTTALQHMLETLTQHHATRVRLAIDERAAQALSAEQSLHLVLVIQEAVSNCIRHGRAEEATVSLKILKQGLRLSIRDNGGGFNMETAKGIGHGLSNMAARAQKIGGRFTVFSKINKGTRIVFDIPKEASTVRY
ncbi:MAG TPA: PAS domain S-box protein [Nitrospiraceae bacterium]|nr:PAS domain S-box protein [Nitrospiraceae bacterium]